ncbi:hypothetical protein WA158_004728 [Blastocystis sp. Blastoise]
MNSKSSDNSTILISSEQPLSEVVNVPDKPLENTNDEELGHREERTSSSFQDYVDKASEMSKQMAAKLMSSIEVLASQEIKWENINEYISMDYQNCRPVDKYVIRPIHFFFLALCVLCNIVDPILTMVACIQYLDWWVIGLTIVAIITALLFLAIRKIWISAIVVILNFICRIATICIRYNKSVLIVYASTWFTISTLILMVFDFILEQVFECLKAKL